MNLRIPTLSLTLCLLLAVTASAHNVIGGTYVEGMLIEGEIGFSDGTMAPPGIKVLVSDESGNSLGESLIREDGIFLFTAKSPVKHVFNADLGAGHAITLIAEADEFSIPDTAVSEQPDSKPSETATKISDAGATAKQQTTDTSTQSSDTPIAANTVATQPGVTKHTPGSAPQRSNNGNTRPDNKTATNTSKAELESIVRRAVAKQLKPLQKELRAYREKVLFRDILGGLGFILGIFGIAAWFAARKSSPKES